MSSSPISLSPDLKRLRDEGYEVAIIAGHLVVSHVPYVTETREVHYAALVSELTLRGDRTGKPKTHVIKFSGSLPCDSEGKPLKQILHSSPTETLADGLVVHHSFSSKPAGGYADYYEKVTAYAYILISQARLIDPDATATTFPVLEEADEESPFQYVDSASSRAGIGAITDKLRIGKVAIVGLGGTGSYILDFVSKTPVGEIHLFDRDVFYQHNAFRAPGAAAIEQLREAPRKVAFWATQYAKMHRRVLPHAYDLDASNADELEGMDFVFLAMDGGDDKKAVIARLVDFGIPFIDVGMGIYEVDGSLAGALRVTTSTPDQRDHVEAKDRISFCAAAGDDDYSQNIQIAELNALNAALAVIKWKKYLGFYVDLEREHFSVYEIDGNHILNEDQA
jgi:hypothetical protein